MIQGAEWLQADALEGRATIQERDVIRQAIPADDMMQAFIYRHLVPAKDLRVAVIGTPRRSTVGLVSKESVKIPAGGTAQVPANLPSKSFFGEIQVELSDPPAGITIEDVTLSQWQGEIVLRSEAEEVQPGLEGNLIVNVFAAKTGEDSGKGKEQRKKRRILLSALPAISFEIVAKQSSVVE